MQSVYLDIDGTNVGGGSLQGEPEDMNAERDLSWVLPAFEKLADAIGIPVDVTEEHGPFYVR